MGATKRSRERARACAAAGARVVACTSIARRNRKATVSTVDQLDTRNGDHDHDCHNRYGWNSYDYHHNCGLKLGGTDDALVRASPANAGSQ